MLGQLGRQVVAQPRHQVAGEPSGPRVVGVLGPRPERHLAAGERRPVPVHPRNDPREPRVHPVGPEGRPGDLDAVGEIVTQAPELLGIHGPLDLGQLARLPPQLLDRAGARLGREQRLQSGFDRQPRVGDAGELQDRRLLPLEALTQGWQRQPGPAPVEALDGDVPRLGPGAEDDVVAEPRQLVVMVAPPELDLDLAELGVALLERLEERRVEEQLLGLFEAPADPRTQPVDAQGGGGLVHLDRGVEGLEQGERPHVSDKEEASRRERPDGPFEHGDQVVDAGEVLRHRVEDHGVESLGLDPREVVGGPLLQLDVGELPARQAPAELVQGRPREVGAAVAHGVRRDPEEQEAGTAADLQDPGRALGEDASDRPVHPLAHLLGGDRLAGVAAVPAGDVERRVDLQRRLDVVAVEDHLPLLDLPGTAAVELPGRGAAASAPRRPRGGRPRRRRPRPASRTSGWPASTASISPSSMRKPRILTWWSMRPRYSRSPSGRRRARSPVR